MFLCFSKPSSRSVSTVTGNNTFIRPSLKMAKNTEFFLNEPEIIISFFERITFS